MKIKNMIDTIKINLTTIKKVIRIDIKMTIMKDRLIGIYILMSITQYFTYIFNILETIDCITEANMTIITIKMILDRNTISQGIMTDMIDMTDITVMEIIIIMIIIIINHLKDTEGKDPRVSIKIIGNIIRKKMIVIEEVIAVMIESIQINYLEFTIYLQIQFILKYLNII
jgi:hypothetical protein